jgi:hypothetical protein
MVIQCITIGKVLYDSKNKNMETQLSEQDLTQRVPVESSFSMHTFEHAQRVAKMLSSSSLIPKEYQGNIQNTMIALEMANRIGASPLMVMQNLYIVHGKPGWSSTFIVASINSCGRFKSLRYDLTGKDEEMKCIAWTVEAGVEIPQGILTIDQAKEAKLPVLEGPAVTMKMAKLEGWIDKNGSKWKTMPELMIRYRAAAFFGRLYAPEIMMGMQTMEEVIDITPSDDPAYTVDDLKKLLEEKMEFISKSELDHARRVIDNNEVTSFKKLHAILTKAA